MKAKETVIAIVLLLGFYACVARVLPGCIVPGIERETVAGLYEAQQLACVDKYADKPSIDKCRARVKASWVVDAGSERGSR